jgi:NAD(P)H dehydrogenase (quinone)
MSERDKRSERPRVLVLGASGLNGGAIVAQLAEMGDVEVVRGARDPRTVASWKDEGKAAILIDLDDPQSFPAALKGIDRLFLMTGYTIHMVHQMKTITDAAVDAGVSFIVHIGVFGNARPIRISPGTSSSNATSREAAWLGVTSIRMSSWKTC